MDIPFLDDELLDLIDLEFDGLEDVRLCVESGDRNTAVKKLAECLRNRSQVAWAEHLRLPKNLDKDSVIVAADAVVRGEIVEQAIPYTFPNGEVDWHYNPTREREDLAVNNEWQWQLNRMSFWLILSQAYQVTGDEIYAKAWVKHLRSWAGQCPRPNESGNVPESAWRTIESGIRMAGSWPRAFRDFLNSSSFTDDDVLLYVKLCIEHARHLRQHHRENGNWLTMEMAGLYSVGALFPEFKDAGEWRAYAANHCYRELDIQFTPDGVQVELSPGYHWVALGNILTVPRVAKAAGFESELPTDFLARAEKAFEFILLMRTPDGSTPRTNDTPNTQDVARVMAVGAELFPERKDFLWAATNCEEGDPPKQTSVDFPYAGFYAMRSGWDDEANMLCFDAGPTGLAHIHQDKLSIALWTYGREMLLDTGGGPYERSKWRDYGLDTFSHNTVLVDGLPQRRDKGFATEPLTDVVWQSADDFDFAAGVYDEKYGEVEPAKHERRILFVKPDLFLVWDVLTPRDNADHTYQARWHLKTTETVQSDCEVVTADASIPNLAVVPLACEGLDVSVVSAQEEPELLGWWIRKKVQPSAVPAATILYNKIGKGIQHFLTLLVPLQIGEENPVQEVVAKGVSSADVMLNDGRVLSCACETDGIMFVEELENGAVGRRIEIENLEGIYNG